MSRLGHFYQSHGPFGRQEQTDLDDAVVGSRAAKRGTTVGGDWTGGTQETWGHERTSDKRPRTAGFPSVQIAEWPVYFKAKGKRGAASSVGRGDGTGGGVCDGSKR